MEASTERKRASVGLYEATNRMQCLKTTQMKFKALRVAKNVQKMADELLEESNRQDMVDTVKRHIQEVMTEKQERLSEFHKLVEEGFESARAADAMQNICDELGIKVDVKSWWLTNTWFTIFRLRQAFFLMCAFSILLSLFTGYLMEIFFSIMGGAHIEFSSSIFVWLKWHVVFFMLPFFMMFLALLGDEMCDLILDSLDFPALNNFQAIVLAAMHGKKDPKRLYSWTVRRADWLMMVVFEFVPIVGALLSCCFLEDYLGQTGGTLLVEGYIQGSLVSAVLCTTVFVIADMRVAYQAKDKNGSDHQSRAKWIAEKMDFHKVQPYSLLSTFSRWKDMDLPLQPAEDFAGPGGAVASPPGAGPRSSLAGIASGLAVVLWAGSVIAFSSFNKTTDWLDPILMGLALVLTVTVCSYSLHLQFPNIYGAPYVLILIFFVLVGVSLNISSALKAAGAQGHGVGMRSIMSTPLDHLDSAEMQNFASAVEGDSSLPKCWSGVAGPGWPQPYPLCSMAWGAKEAQLGALDLANLAWIVYDEGPGEANMKLMLEDSFAGRGAKLVEAKDYETLPRWAHFYFPGKGNATRGTRVIAVKGTSTVMDALVDTNLFSTVKVLQSFQTFLPVLTVLPRLVIQFLLHYVHLGTSRQAEQEIWNSLEADVRALQQKHPQDSFVLTGHSLGGGLAQIVAAKLFLPALVWSAPGAEYSAKRFGIQVQSLKRNVVSVMPDHDVVPRVDLQGGTLQLIECRKQDGSEAIAIKCHSLVKTACEIWRACGDPRDFRRSCSAFVAKKDLGGLFDIDDTTA